MSIEASLRIDVLLYPRHLCRGVYSFRPSVRPFVRLYVRLFVRSFVRTSVTFVEFASKFCVKVSQVVYISASLHIWTIVTLEDRHSLHDHGPQGSCPWVGLEVKIQDTFKSALSEFC